MDTCAAPAADETMTPAAPAEPPQAPVPRDIPGPLPTVPAAAPAASGASPSLALASVVAAGASPGALLAASLVRSRATYFERLSSGSRASTSSPSSAAAGGGGGVPQQDGLNPASSAGQGYPPTPRHSTALAAQPLHPLAPHPLSPFGRAAGGGGGSAAVAAGWRGEDRAVSDSDSGVDEDDSVDTFFDKPSYTCYGAAVELSPASSYGGAARHAAQQQQQQSAQQAAAAAGSRLNSGTEPSAAPAGPVPAEQPHGGGGAAAAGASCAGGGGAAPAGGSAGYVRSMSAHFARVSGGSGGGGGGSLGRSSAGMDGLFDELVTHVGALLASHPDVEAQMGMVQGLSDRLLELQALCETLGRKEDEVKHLRGVLRELTTTRAEAIRLKVQMAESLNGLQQEYYKVLRSAQLAQGTCKQHSVRAAATRKQLLEAQGELSRYKRAVASLRDRNRRLRADNEDMAARLHALEQGRLGSEGHRSACYMTLLQAQTPVLY
ncbi:hypothetical protein PLESTB_000347200 [Pleodorina starrii]|uniref:Uncharacterized protein n=1 Tax=Pleodorina starrii TaxID=330485 RepID=A0A9W6EZ15_9CHLO|nr:hypothetical protein PLESTM_000047500 [Pleodorina starrii]GLC50144.1 hypothetical protein PLESTB_000347200 [Pleodorina starrii]GLC73074.1 hypothetical protein PLESTF_001329100 [Pleodorina starrii]